MTRSLAMVMALALVVVLAFIAGSLVRSRVDAPDGSGSGVTRPAVTTASRIEALQQRLTKNGNDTRSAVELSAAYLQQARETGDPAWHGKAESLLRDVLAREPRNAEAMAWMGALQLSRHEFQAALEWGLKARAVSPDLLAAYPVLIDAYVELGRYDEAVATSDAFVSLRPDLAAYTRVSYLRELHGDREGAIEAMRLALDTAPEGTEPAAWTRVQLGNLFFNGGDPDRAEYEYDRVLDAMPDYAPALASSGRVAAARGDYARAIELLTRASSGAPLPEYVIALGDVHAASGNPVAAEEQYALVRVMTQLLESSGVNSDLELALFDADHPDAARAPEEVVVRAREALEARPSLYAHDVLAWALYRAGDYDAAQAEIERALRLGVEDALLHFHAGAIARALGDDAAAREHLQTAIAINPYFSILHADEARATLAELD